MTQLRPGLGLPPCAPTLTLCDTVLCGQEALLEEALQHGAYGGPVDQLQHEEMGLRERGCSGGAGGLLAWEPPRC